MPDKTRGTNAGMGLPLKKPRRLCPQSRHLKRGRLPDTRRRSNALAMPELPEVETVMRGLRAVLEGRRIVKVERRREGLRFPFPRDFAARLEGRKVEKLSRRAKYILASIEGGDVLLVHLGMTGRFSLKPSPSGTVHEHVVFTLDDGTRIAYSDARRFGMMDVFPEAAPHKLLARIGVEPLGNELNAAYLAAAFAGRKAPLKASLLDQRIIAGLGNIYVSRFSAAPRCHRNAGRARS